MSELMFYGKPVALNREQHQGLHFKPYKEFHFAKEINSSPLTGIEFFEASRDYAILFNKSSSGEYFPFALMSLENQQNSQINDDGTWQATYIPAFVRRYPFALTDDGTVCFDEQSDTFSQEPSDEHKPLFASNENEKTEAEQSSNSETLDKIIQFLQQYDAESKRTQAFTQALAEKELFSPFNVQLVKDQKAAVKLEGLYIIDEKKLNQLDDETISQWFKNGWIAWSYAHLHSLGALTRLLNTSRLSQQAD